MKDIELIFSDETHRQYFVELYEANKQKNASRGMEIGKDIKASTVKGFGLKHSTSSSFLSVVTAKEPSSSRITKKSSNKS